MNVYFVTAKGSVTECAEFNTYSDPEATQFVLNRFGKKFYLADISVCMENSWTWVALFYIFRYKYYPS